MTDRTGRDSRMKALLIVAHGSRKANANRYLEHLTADIRSAAGDRFSRVECAFLQYNGPYAADTIAALVDDGIRHITIFPYFLAAGGHVTSDIPTLVESARAAHPNLVIETTPFLGEVKGLKDLILEAIPAD